MTFSKQILYEKRISRFSDPLQTFSKYIIEKTPGSMGRNGTSHAEQNHSSILSRVGRVCVPLEQFILHLLRRQADLDIKIGGIIKRY